jgi:hypothetical protein
VRPALIALLALGLVPGCTSSRPDPAPSAAGIQVSGGLTAHFAGSSKCLITESLISGKRVRSLFYGLEPATAKTRADFTLTVRGFDGARTYADVGQPTGSQVQVFMRGTPTVAWNARSGRLVVDSSTSEAVSGTLTAELAAPAGAPTPTAGKIAGHWSCTLIAGASPGSSPTASPHI